MEELLWPYDIIHLLQVNSCLISLNQNWIGYVTQGNHIEENIGPYNEKFSLENVVSNFHELTKYWNLATSTDMESYEKKLHNKMNVEHVMAVYSHEQLCTTI